MIKCQQHPLGVAPNIVRLRRKLQRDDGLRKQCASCCSSPVLFNPCVRGTQGAAKHALGAPLQLGLQACITNLSH